MGSANWICWALAAVVAASSQIHSEMRLHVACTLLPYFFFRVFETLPEAHINVRGIARGAARTLRSGFW